MRRVKRIAMVTMTIGLIFLVRAFLFSEQVARVDAFEPFIRDNPNIEEVLYSEYRPLQVPTDLPVHTSFIVDAIPSEDTGFLPVSESQDYHSGVFYLNRHDTVTYPVQVTTAGYYTLHLDAHYLGQELFSPKFGVKINGVYPFYESRQMTFPIVWEADVAMNFDGVQSVHHFERDRHGDDVQPRSIIRREWASNPLRDASYLHHEPLLFYFSEGTHEITIIARSNDTLMGDLKLKPSVSIPDYETYLAQHANAIKPAQAITLQAQFYDAKSDPSIKLYPDQNPASSPFEVGSRRLNAVDAYTFDEAGRSITYVFDVEVAGLYQVTLKYIQYRLANIASFREIKVNGVVPFEALSAYPFPYAQTWANETLGDDDGAYWIYFETGLNTLELISTVEPYRPIIETAESVMRDITQLSVEIRRLTGGQTDVHRDWNLTEFMPDIGARLDFLAQQIEEAYAYAHTINNRDTAAAELVNLKFASERLRRLAAAPDNIPNNMTMLSEGTTSAGQYLGDLMLRLTRQPLGLESIYIHDDAFAVPSPRANVFVRAWTSIQKFFLTFLPQRIEPTPEAQTIEVWVNRPRANIDLMQKMADEFFTPETGIHVNLSLMPNPTKLILANAAGIEPDLALGNTNNMPYEFAIRNAAADLRQFDGYEELVAQFAPGVMIPYVYGDGVYGIPETQDFFLTFYRTDILGHMGASIPNTWSEVSAMLPELRRFGMNYYAPLSGGGSYKGFHLTAPFYFQHGATLYREDAFATTIDREAGIAAMTTMSGLFTMHDMPRQVPNFYNHFRYGTLPIGVANATTYLQLLIAAPEIKGNWDVALYPGTERDGEIVRYASAPTSGALIFSSSKKQALAFEFLSWWMSTETQRIFSADIQTMFGKEYMWFSANLEALASLPLDENHRDIILEQLSWANEAPNVPGGYFLEREISNAWNAIVFNDENVRSAVDRAVIGINREIWRKMAEFGYVDDNQIVREYRVATLETIERWLKEHD